MKRLIVCCDGTWNTRDDEENNVPAPTNVVRLYNSLRPCDDRAPVHIQQLAYYHTGVGTTGGLLNRIAGGCYGKGLGRNIISAYTWLGAHYLATGDDKDRIFLFGFSRGAYTVRCLADMIGRYGLPIINCVPSAEDWERSRETYDKGYTAKGGGWQMPTSWSWRPAGSVRIHFLGVWDTVGALGIPDNLALLNFFDRWTRKHRFPDLTLGNHVERARHAVALDETRAVFSPSLWLDSNGRPVTDTERIKQLWFPGVHADVGGGYSAAGLSDNALRWMIDEAAVAGLSFDSTLLHQIQPNPQGVLHRSAKGGFRFMPTQPRSVPLFEAASHALHSSALARHETPSITQAPYHPTCCLTPGSNEVRPVYANERWNDTGIYIEANTTYRLTAQGIWIDHGTRRDPAGASHGTEKPYWPAYLWHLLIPVRRAAEGLRRALRVINPHAHVPFTRRESQAPWFSLVGIVANGGNPAPDGTSAPHETFAIGRSHELRTEKAGYLHVFANATWNGSTSYRGSVILTVER